MFWNSASKCSNFEYGLCAFLSKVHSWSNCRYAVVCLEKLLVKFFSTRERQFSVNHLACLLDTRTTQSNKSWWRHQMETFSALLALCAGNSPVTGEFPSQRPVTRSFDFSLICTLNKRLSKQSWGWWFETQLCSLWRHCNVISLPVSSEMASLLNHNSW